MKYGERNVLLPLGKLFEQIGDLEKAIELYTKAIQKNHNQPRVHAQIGLILQRQGKQELAIIHYKEALKLDKNIIEVYNYLALIYEMQGDIKEAKNYLMNGLKIAPKDKKTQYNLMRIIRKYK